MANALQPRQTIRAQDCSQKLTRWCNPLRATVARNLPAVASDISAQINAYEILRTRKIWANTLRK